MFIGGEVNNGSPEGPAGAFVGHEAVAPFGSAGADEHVEDGHGGGGNEFGDVVEEVEFGVVLASGGVDVGGREALLDDVVGGKVMADGGGRGVGGDVDPVVDGVGVELVKNLSEAVHPGVVLLLGS